MSDILSLVAAFFLGMTITIWVLFSIGVRNSSSSVSSAEYILVGLISIIPLTIAIQALILHIKHMM